MSRNKLSQLFTWRSAIASEHGPESPTTRHVLMTLSLHMSEKGESCFPSLTLLANETGLAKETVSRHLTKAHDQGWIDKEVRTRGDGSQSSNLYYATFPEQRGVDAGSMGVDSDGGAPPHTGSTHEDDIEDVIHTSARTGEKPSWAPDVDEVIEAAELAGLDEDTAREFHAYYLSEHYLDRHKRPLNWKAKLGAWKSLCHKHTSGGDGRAGNPPSRPNASAYTNEF